MGVLGKEQLQSGSASDAGGQIKDQYGGMPVDSENKARELRVWSASYPHMASFHCAWLGFFATFVSTFAAAPLVPIVRNDIDLTVNNLGNAAVAAVTGTIFCRLVMGVVCDIHGPRLCYALLLLGTAPAVFAMATVTSAIGFLLCRFFIGFGLAIFVPCQFWTSVMFTPKILATANATASGWGNLGGGVTQIMIPVVYTIIVRSTEPFTAWRLAFFVPGCMHVALGVMVLFLAQDSPDAQFLELRKNGKMQMPNGWQSLKQALLNYRMWCLMASYSMCFGVELTMNNVVVGYFFDHFDMPLTTAGLLGSMFGMMNLFARSLGGFISDKAASWYGMRGRLWALWSIQTIEGALCILMGFCKDSLVVTLVIMVLFSTSVQASEGASYGVVPFVSKRSLGVVYGFVGAGGNAGSTITQVVFFNTAKYETYEAIQLMGIMVILVSLVIHFIHFPMWGGMWFPGDGKTTEEDYYAGNIYTQEEKEAGMDAAALKFSSNARLTESSPETLRKLLRLEKWRVLLDASL